MQHLRVLRDADLVLAEVDGGASIMPDLERVLETGQVSRGMRARYRMYSWFMWAMPELDA